MTPTPTTETTAMPHEDPVPSLRVGIVGTGAISRSHAPGWLETGAQLHCFSLSGAAEFAEQFRASIHDTLESLLAAVDVVDICSPTPAHAQQVRAALDAGKDVVCEKPLALTTEDAQELAARAEQAGRLLLPAHVVRYFPQYAAAKAAIDRGAIGQIAVLRFERTGSFPTQPWFSDESQSGGIVMDQMIHDMDQAIWMAGPVQSVYAQQSTSSATDTVRTAHVVLTHRSGAISHCRGLWGPPGTSFRYTFDLAGDAGKLQYDSAADTGIVFDPVAAARQDSGDGFLPDVTTIRSPYTEEVLEFAATMRGEATARVTAADGAYAVQISRAALESIATGRSIAC